MPVLAYLKSAQRFARRPLKQAVISASALSLLYPAEGLPGYSRESFLADLIDEAERDIRECLEGGAARVCKLTSPRAGCHSSSTLRARLLTILQHLVVNNRVLGRFSSAEQRVKIGVHTCLAGITIPPTALDIDYAQLLPPLFPPQCRAIFIFS